MPPKKKPVDGPQSFYHYLKEDLAERLDNYDLLIADMVMSLGIWIGLDTYRALPLLTPWARRDPLCRKRVPAQVLDDKKDEWGLADERGFVKDDNTLIKDLPRSSPISSGNLYFKQKKMGRGFVAAHIWPRTTDNWRLFSFAPNLVWLPTPLAGLTDLRESRAQSIVQALSWIRYRSLELPPETAAFVEQCWSAVREPSGADLQLAERMLSRDNLDYQSFELGERSIKDRLRKVEEFSAALEGVAAGSPPPGDTIGGHYKYFLPSLRLDRVSQQSASVRAAELRDYAAALA